MIRQFRTSLILLVSAIVVLGFSRTTSDPDLWGHLRFGLDLLDTGHVIRPDPYSFLTQGVTWVNHEWLAEALLAVAWRTAGATGIIVLKLTITLAIIGVLYAYLLRRGLTVFGASTVLLVNIPLMLPWLGAARPQMFTYLCWAITLTAIARAEYASSPFESLDSRAPSDSQASRAPSVRSAPRVLWVLPAVFALWANLHGGFLAGMGITGLWVLARAVQRLAQRGWRDGAPAGGAAAGSAAAGDATATEAARLPTLMSPASASAAAHDWPREMREIWLPTAVAVLATLATPYAGELWVFLHTALTSRLEIVEWNPVEAISFEGLAHLVVLVPAVCGWFWSRRERRPALLFLFFVAVLLPMIARRHTPLFAIALVVLAGEHEADAVARMFERRQAQADERPIPAGAGRLIAAMFLVTATICVGASLHQFTRILVDRDEYPVEAVELLRASGVQANMATNFNWGEYVLWHLGPNVKVSIDGRRETVYTDAIYEENQRFNFGYGKWDALIERPGVDLALVPTDHWPVFNLLKLKPGWTVVFQDDRSAIVARQGSPAAAAIARTPRPARVADKLAFP